MMTAIEEIERATSLLEAYRAERRGVELAEPNANHFGRDRSLCTPQHIRVIEAQFEESRKQRLQMIDEEIGRLEAELVRLGEGT